jgi:hypothetical protein
MGSGSGSRCESPTDLLIHYTMSFINNGRTDNAADLLIERHKNTRLETLRPALSTPIFHRPGVALARTTASRLAGTHPSILHWPRFKKGQN